MKATIFAAVWFITSLILSLTMGLLTLFVTDATKPFVWPSALVMLVGGIALMYCINRPRPA
jgi:MFS superfamily sulfate permease-like transporter